MSLHWSYLKAQCVSGLLFNLGICERLWGNGAQVIILQVQPVYLLPFMRCKYTKIQHPKSAPCWVSPCPPLVFLREDDSLPCTYSQWRLGVFISVTGGLFQQHIIDAALLLSPALLTNELRDLVFLVAILFRILNWLLLQTRISVISQQLMRQVREREQLLQAHPSETNST